MSNSYYGMKCMLYYVSEVFITTKKDTMAAVFPETVPSGGGGKSQSVVDDFMYGSNVAGSHVYIRMGKYVTLNL